MNHGDMLVKKERSGKAFGVGGKKLDEFSEKYEFVTQAVKSAEEILRENKPCTSERIAHIQSGQLALNDMVASKVKIQLSNRLKNAIVHCEKDENGVCKNYLEKK